MPGIGSEPADREPEMVHLALPKKGAGGLWAHSYWPTYKPSANDRFSETLALIPFGCFWPITLLPPSRIIAAGTRNRPQIKRSSITEPPETRLAPVGDPQ